MKILIVTHVPITGTYGAASSIRSHIELLGQIRGISFDVIEQIGLHYGPKVQSSDLVRRNKFVLPIVNNYDGFQSSFLGYFFYPIRNLVAFFLKKRFLKLVSKLKPDVIHLNSLVLCRLAYWIRQSKSCKNVHILASVREVLDSNLNKTDLTEIGFIDSFICIDESVRSAFERVTCITKNVVIQQNPFMLCSHGWSVVDVLREKFKSIFAVAGAVTQDKGVLFIIDAFIRANLSGSVLVIVGGMRGEYGEKVKKKCFGHENILLLGEAPNLAALGFYNSIDVIVRADESFRTGRTVYEALYSGSHAIIQSDASEYQADKFLEPFIPRILFYKPRDTFGLIETFQVMHHKIAAGGSKRPEPSGNEMVYVDSYLDIYKKIAS